MAGDGSKGQLGIGECECVFSLVQVKEIKAKKVSCGESHTLIVCNGTQGKDIVKVTGANDKYQLGIQGMKRDKVLKTFTDIPILNAKLKG